MRALGVIALCVMCQACRSAQPTIEEQDPVAGAPRGVAFICPNHDKDDGHELDIFSRTENRVIATIELGDPPENANGEVVVSIGVQPFKTGIYELRIRSKIGNMKAPDSVAWVWEKAPTIIN
jgi:hypothetical protein